MKTKLTVAGVATFLMLFAQGLLAQEQTQKLVEIQKVARRAAVPNMSGFDYIAEPMTSGVVRVKGLSDGGKLVEFVANIPMRGLIAAKLTNFQTGEVLSFDGFDLDYCCGATLVWMQLWNGQFPTAWPAGLSRFDVYNIVDTKVYRATTFVAVYSDKLPIGPILKGPIPEVKLVLAPNGQVQQSAIFAFGNFNGTFAARVGEIPITKFEVQLDRVILYYPPEASCALPEGETTLVFSVNGISTSRVFYHDPSLMPNVPCGKG